MSPRTLDDRVQEIAREVFDDARLVLTDTTVAADVARWDSLHHIAFIYGLEEEFAVQFSEEEFAGFKNMGELKRMLKYKMANGPGD